MESIKSRPSQQAERENWEPMKVSHLGHVSEIIQGGGGKLSMAGHDPGESRKSPGNSGGDKN